MLDYRHKQKDFVTKLPAKPVKTFVRRRLRMRRQGGRHPCFGPWPRPLDRLTRET